MKTTQGYTDKQILEMKIDEYKAIPYKIRQSLYYRKRYLTDPEFVNKRREKSNQKYKDNKELLLSKSIDYYHKNKEIILPKRREKYHALKYSIEQV